MSDFQSSREKRMGWGGRMEVTQVVREGPLLLDEPDEEVSVSSLVPPVEESTEGESVEFSFSLLLPLNQRWEGLVDLVL